LSIALPGDDLRNLKYFTLTIILIVLSTTIGLGYFPEIELIYPPDEHFICESGFLPLTGRTSCKDCILTINNENVEITRLGSFQKNLQLTPGTNRVELILKDSTGNEIIKNIEITNTLSAGEFSINNPRGETEPKKTISQKYAANKTKNEHNKVTITPKKKVDFEKAGSRVHKKDIGFFIEGKKIESKRGFSAINKKNHIMIPLESKIWADTGATFGPGGKSITFLRNAPFKQRTVSFSDLTNPVPVIAEEKIYLPVRSIFENAGWLVHWQNGNIYLSQLGNLRPIQITGMQDIKLETLLYNGVTFLRVEDLLNIKDLNIEAIGSSGVRITGNNGGSIDITRIGNINNSLEMIVKISGDRAPPGNYTAPGKQITENEYLIPVRPVLEQFGFDVRWDSETRTVKAVSEFSVSRTE